MSTNAITTPTSALAITTDVLTLYRVVFKTGTVNDKGEDVLDFDIVNEKVGEEATKTNTFKDKEVVQVVAYSATKYSANSLAGAQELIPDESEFVAMYNRGISTKQDNKFRQILKATEEDGSFTYNETTPYDLRDDLKVATNRRLSPAEKLQNELGSMQFTPDLMAQFERIMAQRKAELGL
jgi:hypothetical protein